MKNEKTKKTLKQTGTHLILILIGFLWSYPFLWMISASFKTPPDFFGSKLNLIPKTFTFDNILRVWTKGHFNIYFLNTVIVTFFSVFLVLTMTRSAGYVFGRYKFFGKKVILSIFLASISIPLVSTLIPVYEVVKSMGLVGTRLGLILSGAGGAHVIFLLLFSSYYQQIPKELEEAAHMDGCGFYRTYSDIMKPMSTPISMTVIIMETIWTWNAFLLPLVLTLNNPSSRTLAVGLYAFRGENTIDWTGIAAGATISVIPIIILFICLQKYVVEGVSGAVKS
jgi:raffinose/stachyose/melibiose transport system permease protein